MNISDELIQEHSDMLKSLETRINDIKMMGTPFIIVEGIDDVGFYEKICEQTNIQAEVVPIQAILGYEGKRGCKPVIEATDIIEKEIEKDDDADKYMKMALGIVDGDARKYKGKQLPYNKVRLVLEHYSFECYFDNEELLKMFLKEHTYISKGLLTSELLSFIKASVSEEYRKVWYLGFEALKSICVESYKGIG